MSRTDNALRNITTIWMEKFIVMFASFVLRTVFIRTLGVKYVGLDGLFTNILTMLSLTELGIGTAMTYSMYKPIADGDNDKLASIMSLYKRLYRYIALIIFILGLLLVPVLKVFVKDPPADINIYIVYTGFLLNTVLSYLFTYKRSMLTANQMAYKYTLIDMIAKIIILGCQSAVLLLFKNYYLYLFVLVLCSFAENAYVSLYVDKLYPFIKQKYVTVLAKEEKAYITKDVKALFLHKFGDFAINSTDNMLISAFINVATVGIVSNYNLIISGINTFINNFFSSLQASVGNLIVEENKEKQLELLETMNFIGFWIYGFIAVGFYFFLTPVVTTLWGNDLALEKEVVVLMVISQYLTGLRYPLSTFKTAAGLYVQDKFVPLIQAVVNLGCSIIAVKIMGLPGIFLGTIASSVLVASWNRAYIVYKYAFGMGTKRYFIKYGLQVMYILSIVFIMSKIYIVMPITGTWGSIIIGIIICSIVYNGLILILFNRTKEFKKVKQIVLSKFFRRKS